MISFCAVAMIIAAASASFWELTFINIQGGCSQPPVACGKGRNEQSVVLDKKFPTVFLSPALFFLHYSPLSSFSDSTVMPKYGHVTPRKRPFSHFTHFFDSFFKRSVAKNSGCMNHFFRHKSQELLPSLLYSPLVESQS